MNEHLNKVTASYWKRELEGGGLFAVGGLLEDLLHRGAREHAGAKCQGALQQGRPRTEPSGGRASAEPLFYSCPPRVELIEYLDEIKFKCIAAVVFIH